MPLFQRRSTLCEAERLMQQADLMP